MRDAWTNPESLATTLLTLYLDACADWTADPDDPARLACLSWHPQTVRIEAEEAAGDPLPEANFARLLAGITILTTDLFFRSVPEFIKLANVLSGDVLDPRRFDPADAAECAWGVTEALLLSPPEGDEEEIFSTQVRRYIGAALDAEGIVHPPDVLRLGIRDGRTPQRSLSPEAAEGDRRKTAEIVDSVRARLRMLVSQLEVLDLEHGNPTDLVEKLHKNLT